jgi:hypothetical protein
MVRSSFFFPPQADDDLLRKKVSAPLSPPPLPTPPPLHDTTCFIYIFVVISIYICVSIRTRSLLALQREFCFSCSLFDALHCFTAADVYRCFTAADFTAADVSLLLLTAAFLLFFCNGCSSRSKRWVSGSRTASSPASSWLLRLRRANSRAQGCWGACVQHSGLRVFVFFLARTRVNRVKTS